MKPKHDEWNFLYFSQHLSTDGLLEWEQVSKYTEY